MNKNKILFLLIILFCQLTAHSQIIKGNWMVGGNASFNSDKIHSTNVTTTNIQLSPGIGYFIWDKFSAGLKLDIAFQKEGYPSSSNTGYIHTNHLIAGPFVRYYFLNEEKLLNLFVEGNYAYGKYKTSGYYSVSDGRTSKYSFLAGPVVYFTNNVGLEFTVGYYNNQDITAHTANNGFQMGIGLQVHLERDK